MQLIGYFGSVSALCMGTEQYLSKLLEMGPNTGINKHKKAVCCGFNARNRLLHCYVRRINGLGDWVGTGALAKSMLYTWLVGIGHKMSGLTLIYRPQDELLATSSHLLRSAHGPNGS